MNKLDIEIPIKEIVDRMTEPWNNQDVEILLSIFHPEMVWHWQRTLDPRDPKDGAIDLN